MPQLSFDGKPDRDSRIWEIIKGFGARAHKQDVRKQCISEGIWNAHDMIDLGEKAAEDYIERLMRKRSGKERMPTMMPSGREPGQYVFYEMAEEDEMAFNIRMRNKQQIGSAIVLKKMHTDMLTKFGWAPEIARLNYSASQDEEEGSHDDDPYMDDDADLEDEPE